jgi:hypothetical protein
MSQTHAAPCRCPRQAHGQQNTAQQDKIVEEKSTAGVTVIVTRTHILYSFTDEGGIYINLEKNQKKLNFPNILKKYQ